MSSAPDSADRGREARLGALSREVHLWLLAPGEVGDEELAAAEALIDERERARHERYLFAPDRRLFLISHAFLRLTLSRYAEVAPQGWRFGENAHGRPELAGPAGAPALCFSLSHTRGLVACLVSREAEAGVDVESLRPLDGLESVARCSFSAQEQRALQELPEAARPEQFFTLWTLKEAYAKARGLGLALAFEKLSFSPGADGSATLAPDPSLGDRAQGWRFHTWDLASEHRMAVAIRAAGPELAVVVQRARGLRD